MPTFADIGGQEPSTITFRVATVQLTRNSTVTSQEILSIGDPDTTNAIAAVLNTTPASTAWALATREVVPQSTTVNVSSLAGAVTVRSSAANALVSVYQSTAADLNVTVAGYVAPSTTVSVSTGSVRVHQSTAADLNVTVAGYSTTINVSSLAGAVNVRSSAANALVTVYQSTAADLNVTVAGYSTTANVSSVAGIVAVRPSDTNWASSAGFHFDSSGSLLTSASFTGSTTVNVSSLAGAVIVRSSAANALVSVYQSTAADLNVTVAGYSTIAAVSSVSGRVGTMPHSTLWASSAGFHFDSSGALLTDASFTGSTTVTVNGNASSNSSLYLPVRLTDGTAFIPISADYTDGSTYSSLTAPGVAFNNSSNNTFRTVGLTTPFPIQVTDSSNAAVKPGDSGNNAIRVNVVAGSAASTTVNVSSLAGIVAVRPSDTNWASSAGFHFTSSGELNVNASFSGSTIVTVSTGSVRVHQSSAADLNVTVAGYSTTANISSLAGAVIVRSSAASLLASVYQSTAADLNVTVAGYSTTVNVSSLAGIVAVRPSDTNWASSAGFHFTSSGELQVNASVTTSTTVNVSSLAGAVIVRSTANSLLATVYQSTAADLNVTVAGYSTTVNISSLAGPVIVRSSAANALITAYQSTAADLLVTASQGGTWNVGTVTTVSSVAGIVAVRPTDTNWASSAGFNLSTAAVSSNVAGLVTREVIDARLTAASTTAFASTSFTIASSVANVRVYVTAYSITTTNAGPTQIGFYSSGNLVWPLVLAATSSAVSGANLAVGHGYIFRGSVNEALSLRTNQSTIAGWQVGVAYYVAP